MSEKNAANFITIPFVAGPVEAVILHLTTQGFGNMAEVHLENDRDAKGDITVKFESKEAADGAVFTTIDTKTIKPGGAVVMCGVTGQEIRFSAQGNGRGQLKLSTDVPTQHVSQLP